MGRISRGGGLGFYATTLAASRPVSRCAMWSIKPRGTEAQGACPQVRFAVAVEQCVAVRPRGGGDAPRGVSRGRGGKGWVRRGGGEGGTENLSHPFSPLLVVS